MKIKNLEPEPVPFSEIEKGDVFKYKGLLYMATSYVEGINYRYYNAVELSLGDLEYFSDDDEVYLANGSYSVE